METVLFDKMSDKFHFIPCTEENLRNSICEYLRENRESMEFRDSKSFEKLLDNIRNASDFDIIQQLLLDVDLASSLSNH